MGEKTDTHQMADGLDEHHVGDDPAASMLNRTLPKTAFASRPESQVAGRIGILSSPLTGRPFIEA
jgi:hypothetical protein